MLRKTLRILPFIGVVVSGILMMAVPTSFPGGRSMIYYEVYPNLSVLPFFAGFALVLILSGVSRLLSQMGKHRRCRLGLCVSCGYNLRGLTELRCPECNTPFEKCSAKP